MVPLFVTFSKVSLDNLNIYQVFEEGITKDGTADAPLSKWASGRQYLLHPVGGLMTYNRRGKREKRKPDIPFQEATLVLEPVSLTISEVIWSFPIDSTLSTLCLSFPTFL